MRLKHENGLLLLEVPHRDDTILMTGDDLTSRTFSPSDTAHSSLTLQRDHELYAALTARCPHIEDCDCAVLASSDCVVLALTERHAFDLATRFDFDDYDVFGW